MSVLVRRQCSGCDARWGSTEQADASCPYCGKEADPPKAPKPKRARKMDVRGKPVPQPRPEQRPSIPGTGGEKKAKPRPTISPSLQAKIDAGLRRRGALP